jgi:hypothetical protein
MFHLEIFYMPQICDMGPMALLPLQRKAWKILMPLAGLEPANLGTERQHATPRPLKPLSSMLYSIMYLASKHSTL